MEPNKRNKKMIQLGWFWWVGATRPDGRSGHGYTLPLWVTLYGMFLRYARGRNVAWLAYPERWGALNDDYEPAAVVEWFGEHGVQIFLPKWLSGVARLRLRLTGWTGA